jgi:hypothetical protein
MPHTDVIPTSASIVSTGSGIRYIGEHCYAFSGLITDNDSGSPEITLLDFISGSGYIDARLSILSDETGAAALYTLIELNGVGVFRLDGDASAIGSFQFDNPFYMIIPPFTHFHLKVGSNSTVVFSAMITGRVYGAE